MTAAHHERESAEVAQTLTVVIRTLETWRGSDEGPVVPDLAVEVGVSDSRLYLPRVLARGRTDATGRATIEVPWADLVAVQGSDARLRALVVEPGHEPTEGTTGIPASPDQVARIRIAAKPGASVSGVLLGPGGEPTFGRVKAWRVNPDQPGAWTGSTSVRVGETGRFLLGPRGAGHYRLTGEGATEDSRYGPYDLGTGISEAFVVPLAEPVEGIEIQVRGAGRVRGRVADPGGEPVGGMQLRVLAEDLEADGRGSGWNGLGGGPGDPLAGGGHREQQTRTTGDGTFDVRGLRPGKYVVRANREDASWVYPTLLTPEPVPSDGTPLELVLARPSIAVSLVDSSGQPQVLEPLPKSGGSWNQQREWESGPVLKVMPHPEDNALRRGAGRVLSHRGADSTRHLFDVEPGHRYLVGLVGSGIVWQPLEVQVPHAADRVEVTYVVGRRVPTGTLALKVLSEDDHYRVTVRPEGGGPVVYHFDGGSWHDMLEEDPGPIELAPGGYGIQVLGEAHVERQHGTLLAARKSGGWTGSFRIESGVTTALTADLGGVAHLRVTVEGQVLPEDVEAFERRTPDQHEDTVLHHSARAVLDLHRFGAAPERVSFQPQSEGGDPFYLFGRRLEWGLPIGTTGTSEALDPGRYVLTARMLGGRFASKEVELVEGETLEVTLTPR